MLSKTILFVTVILFVATASAHKSGDDECLKRNFEANKVALRLKDAIKTLPNSRLRTKAYANLRNRDDDDEVNENSFVTREFLVILIAPDNANTINESNANESCRGCPRWYKCPSGAGKHAAYIIKKII